MKLGIIGQCQGGNAVLWFELFNNHLYEYKEIEELTYICRNENELNAKFKIIKLYGRKPKSSNQYVKNLKQAF